LDASSNLAAPTNGIKRNGRFSCLQKRAAVDFVDTEVESAYQSNDRLFNPPKRQMPADNREERHNSPLTVVASRG
jgi:hypothetical protein